MLNIHKRQFKCNWPGCGNVFQRDIQRNSNVQCHKCRNFLKTTEGTKITEEVVNGT